MRIVAIILSSIIFSGCATVFKGTTERVRFKSNPADAAVFVDGEHVGSATETHILKKGFEAQSVTLKMAGYQDKAIVVEKSFDPIAILNILFWPGFIIDAASGAMMKVKKPVYVAELTKN